MTRPRKQHLVVVLLVLWGLLGFDVVSQGQEAEQAGPLEVIGTGIIRRDDVAKARDEAIEHGLWHAVQEGVGLLIPPASVVSRFQLLNDQVYSRTDEFIHDYKVLTESKSGRYYRVVVRTTLFMDTLRDKLQNIGILVTNSEMPSILFLLSEKNVGEASTRYSWGQDPFAKLPLAVEDTVSRYMRDKGFVILNPGTLLTEESNLEPQYAYPELSDERAIGMAQQVDADVVILGKAVARFSGNVFGTDMKSIEATLSVRALRADNGMAIGSSETTGAAVHANEVVAGTEALTIAASNLAEDLNRQVAAGWSRDSGQTVLVELAVQGIKEYVDFVKFRKILRNEIRGVKNVYLRAIKAGEAKMDVDLHGNTRALADELMLKNFEGFGVNIFEVVQNAIRLELIPKSDVPYEQQQEPVEPRSESW
jgi:hypothetical protein